MKRKNMVDIPILEHEIISGETYTDISFVNGYVNPQITTRGIRNFIPEKFCMALSLLKII
jgi:hypothetical protein